MLYAIKTVMCGGEDGKGKSWKSPCISIEQLHAGMVVHLQRQKAVGVCICTLEEFIGHVGLCGRGRHSVTNVACLRCWRHPGEDGNY